MYGHEKGHFEIFIRVTCTLKSKFCCNKGTYDFNYFFINSVLHAWITDAFVILMNYVQTYKKVIECRLRERLNVRRPASVVRPQLCVARPSFHIDSTVIRHDQDVCPNNISNENEFDHVKIGCHADELG